MLRSRFSSTIRLFNLCGMSGLASSASLPLKATRSTISPPTAASPRCIDATENNAITSGCVTVSGFASACVFTSAVLKICASPKWKLVERGTSRNPCEPLLGHVAERCASARCARIRGVLFASADTADHGAADFGPNLAFAIELALPR